MSGTATISRRRLSSNPADDAEWITLRQAAAILQIHPNSFYKVMAATPIRVLAIPGLPAVYHRADVQRVYDDAQRTTVPTPRTRKRTGGA